MKRIYLIRHGESEANVDLREYALTPDHRISLTQKGIDEATETGKFLKKHFEELSQNLGYIPKIRIYFSSYTRTRQTKDAIMTYIGNMVDCAYEDNRLVEQRFGDFDGLTEEQQKKEHPKAYAKLQLQIKHQGKYWAGYPGAGGESPYDVDMRTESLKGTFYRDYEKHGIEYVVVISHGITTRVMANNYLRLSYEDYHDEKNPDNASVRMLEKLDSGWVDRRYLFSPEI
tara:strand:+ start:9765 stop:10451 length:687 start_codon:yes stop_codon:yes gene_type:complete